MTVVPRPRTRAPAAPLIATTAFGPRLGAPRVGEEIARGLIAGGALAPELLAIAAGRDRGTALRTLLAELGFDSRMRRARAVIIAERRLDERTLEGSAAFEIATRSRQAGVPAYAVTAESGLDAFDARMLDLQLILTASSARSLAAAGAELARVL
jgi:glycerate kinase